MAPLSLAFRCNARVAQLRMVVNMLSALLVIMVLALALSPAINIYISLYLIMTCVIYARVVE